MDRLTKPGTQSTITRRVVRTTSLSHEAFNSQAANWMKVLRRRPRIRYTAPIYRPSLSSDVALPRTTSATRTSDFVSQCSTTEDPRRQPVAWMTDQPSTPSVNWPGRSILTLRPLHLFAARTTLSFNRDDTLCLLAQKVDKETTKEAIVMWPSIRRAFTLETLQLHALEG